MSKNDLADKLAKGVRRALHPSPAEPAPATPAAQPSTATPATTARPDEPAPRRAGAPSALHPARIWPD